MAVSINFGRPTGCICGLTTAMPFLMNFVGRAHGYEVYCIVRDLIEEGKDAKFVDDSGRYVLNWVRALNCYADYSRKKNPDFNSTDRSRRKASNNLRTALLSKTYKKDGAKEYRESAKRNEEGEIVERQFQMPRKVYEFFFGNAELSGSSEEQDEQERGRHLSEVSLQTWQGYNLSLYWLNVLLCKSGTFLTNQHEPIESCIAGSPQQCVADCQVNSIPWKD